MQLRPVGVLGPSGTSAHGAKSGHWGPWPPCRTNLLRKHYKQERRGEAGGGLGPPWEACPQPRPAGARTWVDLTLLSLEAGLHLVFAEQLRAQGQGCVVRCRGPEGTPGDRGRGGDAVRPDHSGAESQLHLLGCSPVPRCGTRIGNQEAGPLSAWAGHCLPLLSGPCNGVGDPRDGSLSREHSPWAASEEASVLPR